MSDNKESFYTGGFQDLSKYRLERTTIGLDWDNCVVKSEQGTLFSESYFLSSLETKIGLWVCYRGKEVAALVHLIEDASGKSAIQYPGAIYNGVLFMPAPQQQNRTQSQSEQFRILAFLSGELAKIYKNIFMSFHWLINDVRPFLWHNYSYDGPKFEINIRYTSIIDLAGHQIDMDELQSPLYKNMNKSRRQEVRYAQNKGYYTKEEYNLPLFLDFYKRTFNRQNIAASLVNFRELKEIISNLYKNKRLIMLISYNPSNEPSSIAIFGHDNKRWYYLYGASNPDHREGHAGTLVLWDAFTKFLINGPSELDLEGVNSPRRGYFKLSFGGQLLSYLHVTLKSH